MTSGVVVYLDAFRALRAGCPGNIAAPAVSPAKRDESGTIKVNAEILSDQIDELMQAINTGISTLHKLGITVEYYRKLVDAEEATIKQVRFDCPLPGMWSASEVGGPVVLVTEAQLARKDKLLSKLESFVQAVYAAVALAVEHQRLRRWVEVTGSDLPPAKLSLAPKAKRSTHLLEASTYAEDGLAHLDNCGSLLATAGLAIAGYRLKEARKALLSIDNIATIFRAVQNGIAEGSLVAVSE